MKLALKDKDLRVDAVHAMNAKHLINDNIILYGFYCSSVNVAVRAGTIV